MSFLKIEEPLFVLYEECSLEQCFCNFGLFSAVSDKMSQFHTGKHYFVLVLEKFRKLNREAAMQFLKFSLKMV